mgnify:CR=1 FL=1
MIEELVKNDPDFNEGMFKSYIDNIFVKVYTALMLDELETIRHFVSEELYRELEDKLKRIKDQGLIQMYDELNVKSSEIERVEITDKEFIVYVRLVTRYMDYMLDSESGNLVRGDNTRRIEVVKNLIFKKKRDYQEQGSIRRCPGCGASIDVNDNGICSYCGTSYNLEKYNYILDKIN